MPPLSILLLAAFGSQKHYKLAHAGSMNTRSHFRLPRANPIFALDLDCKVSGWGRSTDCTRTCGIHGIATRTRSIIQKPENGGMKCGPMTNSLPCYLPACDVDCIMSSWSSWSSCSKSCEGGTRKRTRSVIQPQEHIGAKCPKKVNMGSCNPGICTLLPTLSPTLYPSMVKPTPMPTLWPTAPTMSPTSKSW
jgi:hypothetical protein